MIVAPVLSVQNTRDESTTTLVADALANMVMHRDARVHCASE
jgi:hypothetical protein